jgi:hypothetical protein
MDYEIRKKKLLRESLNLNSFAAAVADVERQLHSVINFIRGIPKFQISCQPCTRSLI